MRRDSFSSRPACQTTQASASRRIRSPARCLYGPRVVPTRSASPDRGVWCLLRPQVYTCAADGDHPRSGTSARLDREWSQLAALRQAGECGAFHVRRSIPALRMETIRGPGPARVWSASCSNSQHFASPESVVLFTFAGINLRCGWRPSAVRDQRAFGPRVVPTRSASPDRRVWCFSRPRVYTCAADGDHPRSGTRALLDRELSQLAALRQTGECGAFHVRRSIPALRMETIRAPGSSRS